MCLDVQEFYSEVREVDRDNEVNRILGAFKLNPFEQLGLRFNATLEDIRRQYRKVSLLVHPDKCKHPRAKDAFEVIGVANKELTDDDRRKEVLHVLNLARGESPMSFLLLG
jgi:DnaJ homolog subfamily C member 8